MFKRYPLFIIAFAACSFCTQLASANSFATQPEENVRRSEMATPTRAYIDLDGDWEYSADGSEWSSLRIPCSLEHTGVYSLRKSFSLSDKQISTYTWKISALGINYQCDIYINGQFLTHHVGGYTGCMEFIPDYMLHAGGNTIRIDGSNELSTRETLPEMPGALSPRNYGGVYRDIAIIGMPVVHINDIEIHTNADPANLSLTVFIEAGKLSHAISLDSLFHGQTQATIAVRAEITESSAATPLLTTQEYTVAIADFRSQQVRIPITIATPHLWSPISPFLYHARCSISINGIVLDESTEEFGIRNFTSDGTKFLLNGSPCEINGVMYEEDLQNEKSAMNSADYIRDIELIKTLGANAIRLDHPASPVLLTICDAYGIMVFEQIPDQNVPAAIQDANNYIMLAKNCAQAMILRDRNHPSVIAWGLASLADPDKEQSYFDQVSSFIHSFDNRQTYCTTWDIKSTNPSVNFCFLDLFDVSTDDFQQKIATWKSLHPNEPFVVARYGKAIKPDDHNGYTDPLSAEAQAKYLLTCFTALQHENAAGGFISSFGDWGANRPSLLSIETNPSVNFTGLVSYSRDERRLSFDVVKAMYTGDKIPTIIVGEDPSSPPIIYIIVGLLFLLALVYLANNSRRFRENFSRAVFRPFNFYADIRDQRILSTFQTTILGVITAGTYAMFVSSVTYYIRMNVLFDNLLNVLLPWNAAKYPIARMIWNPVECVIVLTLLFFAMQIIIAGIIRGCAMFIRPRIFFGDVYSIVLWAGLPSVILIPLSMILYRVMILPQYVAVTSSLAVFTVFWILFRVLRGTAVVFDIPFRRVYTGALALLLGAGALIVYYYDSRYSVIAQITLIVRQMSA